MKIRSNRALTPARGNEGDGYIISMQGAITGAPFCELFKSLYYSKSLTLIRLVDVLKERNRHQTYR
jgi:hypothetical protein